MQDNFKIGLAFAGKSINLYTPFTTSDIIVGKLSNFTFKLFRIEIILSLIMIPIKKIKIKILF